MSSTKLLLAISVLLCASISPATAQKPSYQKLSRSKLLQRVRELDNDAILELGRRRITSQYALLKSIAVRDIHSQQAAKQALARMGDEQYFQEFILGLSTTNAVFRSNCIIAMGYIGDKRAIPSLGPILYEEGGIKGTPGQGFPSYWMLAVESLGELLPDVQTNFKKNNSSTSSLRYKWQSWWQQNKNRWLTRD